MGFFVNLYANVSGLWKKVSLYLPLLAGVGSLLVGIGHIAIVLSHAPSADAMLAIIKGLGTGNPDFDMIVAGLTALGIHTNHSSNVAVLADHSAQLSTPATPK